MITTSTRELFRVHDIAQRDLDYLTELRDRIATPLLDTTADAQNAIRRLYVRIFITMIESAVATIKTEVLQDAEHLSDAERTILRDITFDLNDKGEPVERPLHPPLLSSLKFSLRMFTQTHQLRSKPDYSGRGWQAIQEVVRLRNRLTHPKLVEDLQVSESDLSAVDEAEAWFLNTHTTLLEEYNAVLQKQIDAHRIDADTSLKT
jgi:hypothetical protein